MPKFGADSLVNLAECHADLQRLFEKVVAGWDCKIVDGARTLDEQRRNVLKGVSQTMDSKHIPREDGKSHAVDAVPYPLPSWDLVEKALNAVRAIDPTLQLCRFYAFNGYIAGVADSMGIEVRQGCDWDSDRQFGDHSFIDLPHTELRGDV